MSYDLELFQLREGVTVKEINEFLASDEYEAFIDEMDEREEEGEETTSLPERFVNTDLARADLERLIGKAWLRALVPEEERSDALKAYLSSHDTDREAPGEHAMELASLFEWKGEPGIVPLCFSYGGALDKYLGYLAEALVELEAHRIVALDPQLGKVVGGASAPEMLRTAAQDASEFFQDFMNSLQSGELEEEFDLEEDGEDQ